MGFPPFPDPAQGRSPGRRQSRGGDRAGARSPALATVDADAQGVGAALADCADLLRKQEPRIANAAVRDRSEEHTSELQSLMRISYAVFCLKKKRPKRKTYAHDKTTQH